MYLIGISQVKNESDIIETSIRENLRVLDIIFVLDDSSEDDTLAILKCLVAEKLPVVLLSLQDKRLSIFYDQGKSMTYLMQYAIKYCLQNHLAAKIDFVFPLDADEIIGCNREEVECACMSIPKNHYGLLRWKNYLPYHGQYSSKKCLIDVFRSPHQETKVTYKSIIPGNYATTSAIRIGSHSIVSRQVNLSPFILEQIPLLHFPVRSSKQIIGKSLIAAHKTSLRTSPRSRENYHLKELANAIRASNYHLIHEDLYELSNKYISTSQNIASLPDRFLISLNNELPRYPANDDSQLLKSLDTLLLNFTNSGYSRLSRIAFWIHSKINKLHFILNSSIITDSFKEIRVNEMP